MDRNGPRQRLGSRKPSNFNRFSEASSPHRVNLESESRDSEIFSARRGQSSAYARVNRDARIGSSFGFPRVKYSGQEPDAVRSISGKD